ncbi:Opacity protein opA54, partial [Neisseria meningitidis]|uniref:opacity family porin n=1 Tax=Neisseria meningitidis TaxID=487 RepID=UPI000C6E3591
RQKERNTTTKKVNEEINNNYRETQTKYQGNDSYDDVSSLGLSAIYDFKLNEKLKPYIGPRVDNGHVKQKVHSVETKTTTITSKPKNGSPQGGPIIQTDPSKPPYHESHSISSVGLGVIAGVGFDITPKLTLDTGYRYHNWGRLQNTRFKTHEVSSGMRYHF